MRPNPTNRRTFLKTTSAALLSSLTAANADSQQDVNRYNVLFIAVDDLRPELGCYGKPYAISPNIDAFSKTSLRFTNHFVQVATCGASRYCLLTGRSPLNSGVTRNNHAFYRGDSALLHTMLEGAQSLPEQFRRSGYHTVCIGKMSHTADGKVYAYNGEGDGRDEIPYGWNELATPYGPWERGWGVFFAYEGGKHREDGQGHIDLQEFTAEHDTDLPDGMLTEEALEQFDTLKDSQKPFFLGLGFFKPHLPFVATKKDWEAVKDIDVPLAPHQDKPESPHWHKSNEFYKYDMPYEKTYPLAEDDQQNARRAYLACVRYIDRQIGKVLDKLEETGLADNTIVVFWGDHGWHLGDSQLWGKHTPFERAMHSPLMVRVPGMDSAGKECDALVDTLDIYPTLVDLCKPEFTKTRHSIDGKSLVPLINNPAEEVNEYSYSYWNDFISMRSQRYRLIAQRNGNQLTDIELYDIQSSADPTKSIAERNPEIVTQFITAFKQQVQE